MCRLRTIVNAAQMFCPHCELLPAIGKEQAQVGCNKVCWCLMPEIDLHLEMRSGQRHVIQPCCCLASHCGHLQGLGTAAGRVSNAFPFT